MSELNEISELLETELDLFQFNYDETISTFGCCRSPISNLNQLEVLPLPKVKETCLFILETLNRELPLSCLINEIYNSCLVFTAMIKNQVSETQSVDLAFCDSFLRLRHDLLHEYMMKILNIEQKNTDVPFSILGIESNRTPDYIEKTNDGVLVIETTVTTDRGKSYLMKGRVESGYKPKYEREFEQLKELGLKVYYSVIVFDVKDSFDQQYKEDIKNICKYLNVEFLESKFKDLELLRRSFCTIHEQFGKIISRLFTMIFKTEFVPDKYPREWIEFMMRRKSKINNKKLKYNLLSIGMSTFNKIQRGWLRLNRLLDSYNLVKNEKMILIIDLISNKMKFENNRKDDLGLTYSEWQSCINNDDKVLLFQNIRTMAGDVEIEDSGRTIEFIYPSYETTIALDVNLPEVNLHKDTIVGLRDWTYESYENKIIFNEFLDMEGKYEDDNYEFDMERMITDFFRESGSMEAFKTICKDLKHKKPFAHNYVSQEMFTDALQVFECRYNEINDINSDNRKILHQKPSFLYPLFNMTSSTYCSYKKKPNELINALLRLDLGHYTNAVIKSILDSKFELGTSPTEVPPEVIQIMEKMSDIQRIMHKTQMTHKDENGNPKSLKIIPGGQDLLDKYKSLRQECKRVSKGVDYKKSKIAAIRMPTRNKKNLNSLGSSFAQEMSHFKQKKEISSHKGVGRFDFQTLESEFNRLKATMLSPCGVECPDLVYDTNYGEDVALLAQLKKDSINNKSNLYDFLKGTNLYHTSAIITRLCYTLMYFSQTSIGSDYVMVDNLGVNSALLICKGGKKIFRTKRSKLYRLFFKTYDSAVSSYTRAGYNSNFQLFKLNGQSYICTPWMSMEETLLTDGLTFLSRAMGYCMMNVCNRLDGNLVINDSYFNIILAMHGRRKTEEFMHNIRYITVNCMSDISCVDKMLPELADFNGDFFQCYLRESIVNNFKDFSSKIKMFHDTKGKKNPDEHLNSVNLKHLFDKNLKIDNTEMLTMVIYCTFLMSKAPITQSLEQVKNLRNILKTHEYHQSVRSDDYKVQYEKSTCSVEDKNLVGYWNNIFENDFVYDPKYVTMLGNLCADYLLSRKSKGELEQRWDNIVQKPWDSMANTAGLRGDKGPDFFGKKGYYIVYDHVMKDESVLKSILELLDSDLDDHDKRKKLNSLNQSYASKIDNMNFNEVIFHVVDKKQRGGSREIFVMDYKTKINQQPIEKYAAYLCKIFPNEVISIPSNRRLFHIHSNVFERFMEYDCQSYNVVLDCRRWAPHSVINKFIDFLIGMRAAIPKGFFVHCLNFFSLMFDKKVYTRRYVKDIIVNNEGVSDLMKSYLIDDEELKGSYLKMSYSWMMGIFNYFSSLLHVVNQMHISQILIRCNMKADYQDFNIHMNAHSDDSGGKMVCREEHVMRRSFLVYELLLKSSNHLLSDKKCNIGKVYFELLSILYVGNKLLSLISKFAGSFNFHPTDSGYALDVTESYSKCTELIVNGATFDQAYIAMKIMAYLIWRFYFGPKVHKFYYNLPPQLLGMPDAHPINVLMSGGDSDIIRLHMVAEKKNNTNFTLEDFVFISKHFSDFNDFEDTFLSPFKCQPQIIMSKKMIALSEKVSGLKEEYAWLVNNLRTENTSLNLLSYIEKLKQKNFCATLQDETITRRISRAFYFRSSRSLVTNKGDYKISEMRELLNLYFLSSMDLETSDEFKEISSCLRDQVEEFKTKNSNIREYFNILHSEIIAMNRSFDNIGYTQDDIKVSKKSCKPIHINIQRVNTPLTADFSPETLTAWMCFPNLRWMLPSGNYSAQVSFLEEFFLFKNSKIPIENANWIYKLLSKYKGKYIKEFFIHSNMPSGMRDISTYRDILSYLSHNSIANSHIEGIISPYNRLMNVPIEHMFSDFMDDELNKILNLLDFVSGLFSKPNLYSQIMMLDVNDGEHADIMDYLQYCCEKFGDKLIISDMLIPHMYTVMNADECGRVRGHRLKSAYFHCFVKKQHLIGNVWLGRGRLYINLPSVSLQFEIEHMKIISVIASTNSVILNRYEVSYIDYVLQNAQLPNLKTCMDRVEPKNWMKKCLGLNVNGVFEIAEARSLIYYVSNTSFRSNVHWTLSNLDLCEIKVLPRIKYLIKRTDFEGHTETHVIHTFDVPIFSVLSEVNKLFNSDKNRDLVNSIGRDYKEYLNEVVGESAQTDLEVPINTLLDNYSISMLGNIIKSLVDIEEINVKRLNYRVHMYPAQDDGMLDLLIKYKTHNEDFLFNYKNLVTPEMMYLKSSQPMAFMSNLVTNIKEKYYSLYNGSDRQQILDSLWKVYSQLNSVEGQRNMVSLLTTWGYIGVMGSINETSGARMPDSFKFFRYKPDDVNIAIFSKRILSQIFSCMLETYMSLSRDVYMDENWDLPRNMKQMQLTILGYLQHHVLTTYTKFFKNNMLYLDMPYLRLWFIIKSLFSNEEYRTKFHESTKDIPILSNMPIGPEYTNDWMRSLNTLINCLLSCEKTEVLLNNNALNQQIHNSPNPIIKLKNLTSDIGHLKYNLKGIFHNGTVDRNFYVDRKGIKTVDMGNGNFITFEMITNVKYSKRRMNFHKKFVLPRPLTDELEDDDDFDDAICDLNMELLEEDPDESVIETVTTNDEWMVPKNPRYIRVKMDSNRSQSTPFYRFGFFNIVGTQGSNDYLEYIHNSYETFVIMAEYIINPLFNNETGFVKSFRNKNRAWIDRSVIDPKDIIFYVKDSKKIVKEHWEKYLNAELIETDKFNELTSEVEYAVYYDKLGVKNDFNLMNRDSQEGMRVFIDNLDRMEEPKSDEEKEEELIIENIKTLIDEIEDLGIDSESISRHKKRIEAYRTQGGDIIEGLKLHVAEIVKEKEYIMELKDAVSNIIKQNRDKQFVERVFELPGIFSIGQHTESMVKNRSLKDRRLRAEIDSLSSGLTDKILSNTLNISEQKLKLMRSQLKLAKAYIQINREKKKNKVFLTNAVTLILNDASVVVDTDCDNIWDNIIETMSNYITADEDDSDSDDFEAYDFNKHEGHLNYKIV